MMEKIDYHGYTLTPVYGHISPELGQEIINFWVRNNAIGDPGELQRRVKQVVYTSHSPEGELIGVSTVYLQQLGQQGVYFFYRMFIQANHRRAGMMRKMTESTRFFLRDTPMDNKPRGMIIVTENQKLMRKGMHSMFERHGYIYMGRTPRSLDMWCANFT